MTFLGQTSAEIAENVTRVSRGIAVVFLFTYAACLFFQLKTHASMYNTPGPKTKRRSQNEDVVNTNAVGSTEERSPVVQAMDALTQNSEEPSEQAQVRLWVAILTLVVSTIFVGICADFMTRAINDMSPRNGTGKLSRTFVGLILVPIVGNAAEHATAVTMAIKDKMDLAIGVAIGSSTQIALGVIPFVVVVGWILGNEDMNLAFDGFQIALLIAAVFLISSLIQDGKSNW